MFFLGALYMQRILGYDALEVGLAYLPLTVVMGTMSFRFTGQLNLRFGPQATLIPAMAFIVAGLLLLARTPVDATYVVDLLPPMILIGLGAGLGFPSLMTLAMSGATERDSGLASGLVNTSVQVGGAIGLAILATFATERTDALLADGETPPSSAQLRLPPRVPDRCGPRARRDPDRAQRPALTGARGRRRARCRADRRAGRGAPRRAVPLPAGRSRAAAASRPGCES